MSITAGELFGPQNHRTLTPAEAGYAARVYLSMGWAVTAGPGLDANGVCACYRGIKCGKNAGKHAHAGWGNDKRRTMTPDQASRYWSENNSQWASQPVDQVFIVPYLSGLVVADVDDMSAWLRLAEVDRPVTLFQRSGSGRGGHFIYRYTWDTAKKEPPRLRARLRNAAGEIKFRGIIAAAPDPHRCGGRYTWENWGIPVAQAPAWLIEERGPSEPAWNGVADLEMMQGFWGDVMFDAALRDIENLSDLRQGAGRPVVLFAVASKMMYWVKAGRITQDEVKARLMEVAMANHAVEDYTEEDIERQIDNGLRAGGAS